MSIKPFKFRLFTGTAVILGIICIFFSACSGYNPATTPANPVASSPSQTTTKPSNSAPSKTDSPSIPATKDESVSVVLDKQQVNPGDSFTINLVINTKVPSQGAQASLIFDPAAMSCNTVTEGDFYKTWAAANGVSTTMMPAQPAIDNDGGIVQTTAVMVMGQTTAEQQGSEAGGAQGQGVFLSFQMTAKSGISTKAVIKIGQARLTDSNGDPITNVNIVNGQVTIGTP